MGNTIAGGIQGGIVSTLTISHPVIPEDPTFKIDVVEELATILARSGDAVGVIAYGTDTHDIYVYDGTSWQTYENT